jgi:integrase/recombinase XerD
MSAIAPALQEYFTQRLISQRQASPHTVAAYRDCFRLLFAYVARTSGKQPAELGFEDLDAGAISGFLTHLEKERGVSVATRNARLVALRSWFAFAAHRHPEHAALIARVLAIPSKRRDRPLVSFLEPEQADALLKAPGTGRWTGRRDRALLTFAVQTGLRASELTAVRTAGIALGRGAHVQVLGKGRKERAVPLSSHTVAALRPWLSERSGDPRGPVFPGPSGHRLSRDTVRKLVIKHARSAAADCPSLAAKKIGRSYPSPLCGWLGYVAGSSISAGSRAARASSGHITRWCYSQKRSSHARRSWSAVQSARGSGVSDW